ncbi:hypothetical protein LGQ02_16490 [Bacillus shivajii]|uniref:hypothetical protein n=1 Tax=Bacillus shivajii TaxID=1983719 RepID=UPI001CFA5FA5|nr:hypothetical protein [Bacillus shivajii]UCZ52420.1 hypothetical protein LGQ02_16490 [Bacillus shivajii]
MVKNSDELLPLEIECISFFEENRFTFETVEGIANRLGRHPEDIQIALEELNKRTILAKIDSDLEAIYHYREPDESLI